MQTDLRVLRKCTGRQAVAWLLETARVAADEFEAVRIGNAMLQLGLLHHAVGGSLFCFMA